MTNFLQNTYLSNTGMQWLTAIAVFVVSLMVLKIVKSIVVSRLKKFSEKTKNDIDDTIIDIVASVKPPFYFIVSLYIGTLWLAISGTVAKVIWALFLTAIAFEAIAAIQKVITYIAKKAITKEGDDEQAESTIRTLSVVVKIILWSIGLVLVLGNLGIDVTSLVAGLGIGGVAIALAMQNILADVFASFSILIDKPFGVGDFIKSGDDMGTVEKIGIKTTRLRTPDGEQLIISNKELTEARVQNFKRLEKRRALFSLGVIYETPKEKLEKIPTIIQGIIESLDKAEFDRAHFKSFGDFSLNFEVALYVETQDYKEYLDVVQAINLQVFDEFDKEGIEFAYPTAVEYQKKAV